MAGMSRDQGYTFSKAFSRRIEGNVIRGKWAHIPRAVDCACDNGQLTLLMDRLRQFSTTLTAIERTGGFSATIWRKLYDQPFISTAARDADPASSGDSGSVVLRDPVIHTGYCAYHSYGSCGPTPVQFAFFFNLDGDPGCDPQDTTTGHSQGLAALANVSGHELSEARTDPRNGGWYDSSGQENGDKCSWTFNVPFVTFPNGSSWKIQGEWSNKAYDGGTGYPNSSGQKGCLDGH